MSCVVASLGRLHIAIQMVGIASIDFDLDGGVGDLKIVVEFGDDGSQDLLAVADGLFFDDDVATAGDGAGADGPDVQVVDVANAGDLANGGEHGRDVNVGGGGFH